ncbi:MAG: hypothetical protein LBU89_04660 [Fibromonadaceae bacterium]|jgi:hypothetical protein|nr:hypothetical protein [Fibromonadaceae bacterium]
MEEKKSEKTGLSNIYQTFGRAAKRLAIAATLAWNVGCSDMPWHSDRCEDMDPNNPNFIYECPHIDVKPTVSSSSVNPSSSSGQEVTPSSGSVEQSSSSVEQSTDSKEPAVELWPNEDKSSSSQEVDNTVPPKLSSASGGLGVPDQIQTQ